MKYVSTRGKAAPAGFQEVLLAGLAPDGGLYVPEGWPTMPSLPAAAPGHYAAAAAFVMAPCMGGNPGHDELLALVSDAYAGWSHPDTAPLTQIGRDLFLLELFHGPTAAFKDFAMQVLSRLMERALKQTGSRTTILGRDLRRHGCCGGGGVPRPAGHRAVHSVSAWAHQRRAAQADDHGARGQYPRHRRRRHVRRRAEHRENAARRRGLPHAACAFRDQLHKLGTDRGANRVLLHGGGKARTWNRGRISRFRPEISATFLRASPPQKWAFPWASS